MAITAGQIFDKIERLVVDETNVRWTVAELLGWLNSGQREIVLLKPNSLTATTNVTLVAGTKQELPATGLVLIDVTRNMGSGGTTAGRAITPIDRRLLDTTNPNWHADTAAAEAKHYCYDIRNPKVFYVWPPQPTSTTQQIEIIQSISPTDATTESSNISLDDIYEGPLIDYILYRAYSKDAEFAGSSDKAQVHYQAFQNALGIKLKGEGNFGARMKFTGQAPGGVSGGQPQ